MGNLLFKFFKGPEEKPKENVTSKTEVEFDSMEVPEIILPDNRRLLRVNLGYVNSVREEIERLGRQHGFQHPVSEYQMVVYKHSDSETDVVPLFLEPLKRIEQYRDELSCKRSIIKIVHDTQDLPDPQPNTGSLNINVR